MIRKTILTAALVALMAGSASGEPAPSAARPTIQQRFDAGGEALKNSEWQKAYDIYSALESDISAKHPDSTSLPIIRLRKGQAMAALQHSDEAEPILIAALDALPNAPELADDKHYGWMALADIADVHLDFPLAVARWHQAADVASHDMLKLAALLKAAPVAIFVDPAVALRDLDAAQALVGKLKLPSPEWPGLIHDFRGRTLMNTGDLKAARAELDKSIKLLGGLSYKVNLLDLAARSDGSIAAMLDKDPEQARKLLFFAGASMAADQGFVRAQDISPPACDIPGLAPTDVAVIQFAIRDDGSVAAVRPIYFSGERSLAVEFARAVARWSWSAEQLKDLEPFFRAQARIELRCTNRFKQPGVKGSLNAAIEQWAKQSGLKSSGVSSDLPDGAKLPALKAELAQRRADSAMPLAALPTLMALAENQAVPRKERAAFAQQAYDLAVANGARGEVKAWFLLTRLSFDDSQWRGGKLGDRYQLALAQALTDRTVSDDARAEAALRIALFDSLNARSRKNDGKAILEPLVSSQRLEKADPFRVGALIRMANLEYAAGNLDAARERFQQSGITAQQCALVDAKPAQTRGVSADDFPTEAWRWSLGGWTMAEFDISPEGMPLNIRTVAAFPPFVFGEDSEGRIKRSRYQQTYRPGSERGCVANNFGVDYQLRHK